MEKFKDQGDCAKPQSLRLTSRFASAVDYARIVHVGTRKKTAVPYTAHLLGVASLVMGETGHVAFPVTEDMAIAALLHDAVEDAGGMPRLHDIEANFGPEVARIVAGCSDSFVEDSSEKKPWEQRKKDYIERLNTEPEDTLLVSAADKLYNVRSIVEEHRSSGAEVWRKFTRGPGPQLWYYAEVLKVFEKRCPNWRIVSELARAVAELAQIAVDKS
jgi:(p)ppGpp synthase/HD superfamily hydrolase